MKLLLVCALFACSAVFASALQSAICYGSEDQVKEQMACVRDQAGVFNDRLDLAVNDLGCADDVCAIKKLCTFVNPRPERTLFRGLARRCTAAAVLAASPAAAVPVPAPLPVAPLPAAAVPVAAAAPAFLAPRPFLWGARGLGDRAFGARPFGARAFGLGAFGPGAYGVW
ncbi:hypothetical protein MTO96_016552 [Rhipicephalus appendiculatus]